ncbi:very short patch repair endonuclease [Lactobacillus crispatus]
MTKINFKTSPQISKNMKLQSHGKSKTEDFLAHTLWNEGIRYRRNYKALPGKPDIAITKYKIAIFVDGEFWHGFNWKEKKKRIKRNRSYWIPKIEKNKIRDQHNDILLKEIGWTPIHFWGNQVLKNTDYCVELIKYLIRSKKVNGD